MNLDQQIQALIDKASLYRIPPKWITEIAPVLVDYATGLQHSEYYILQSQEDGWLLTTLSNRAQVNLEKNVIHAFSTLEDANLFSSVPDPEIIALPEPVTHILFEMVGRDIVDSTIFFETPGNRTTGAEIFRENLLNRIKEHRQQHWPSFNSNPRNLPPDIA